MKHERMVPLARGCVVTKPVLFILPLGHEANCEDGGCEPQRFRRPPLTTAPRCFTARCRSTLRLSEFTVQLFFYPVHVIVLNSLIMHDFSELKLGDQCYREF